MGKNSPIVLTLGKDNYEALIERHGQWIRWQIANKCSCVKDGMQPDIHCKLCGGLGYQYTFQKDNLVYETVMINDTSGIISISDDNKDAALIEVYDFTGKRYTNAEKLDCFITLNEPAPQKGTYIVIVMRKLSVKKIEIAETIKQNDLGYFQIKGLRSKKPNIEGLYYDAPGDVLSIGKIKDAAGLEYEPKEFRLDMFRIEPHTEENEVDGETVVTEIPITEPVICEDVTYMPPYIFALLNQNISKADAQAMVDVQGDAVVTFPYGCDVAQDDVLTVLAGSNTQKDVIVRTSYKTDTLGSYFVKEIVSITGIDAEGKPITYKQGVDYILVDTNKIKWLETDNSNYPEEGEPYSVVYHYLPTYRVVKEIPQLRTSENQRFPKKAVVKIYSNYSEMNGVNRQRINSFGNSGTY